MKKKIIIDEETRARHLALSKAGVEARRLKRLMRTPSEVKKKKVEERFQELEGKAIKYLEKVINHPGKYPARVVDWASKTILDRTAKDKETKPLDPYEGKTDAELIEFIQEAIKNIEGKKKDAVPIFTVEGKTAIEVSQGS